MRVDSPPRDAARARAAVTVVLPTPPFPATMSSRAAEQNWEMSIRRRRLPIAVFVLATALLAGGPLAATHAAQAPPAAPTAVVDVVEVSGLIDPILVDFVSRALRDAERERATALVIRVDSTAGVVGQTDIDALAFRISHSPVPVAVWVGPGRRARAYGAAFQLMQAAHLSGVSPGSRVGRSPAPVFGGDNPLGRRTISSAEALEQGVADIDAATLGDFVVALDGRQVAGRTLTIPTEVVRREGRPPQRQLAPAARVAFGEPSLPAQLLHAVATPAVAYLFLVLGLLLVVFEFYTAGVGVAGGVAALSLGLSAYGLGVLPTRPLGLALLVVGVLGYAVDLQAGTPRTWTVIGTVSLVAGSLTLYGQGHSVPLPVLFGVLAGVALFMVAGMPAMVRTRFSTPTIGRESMIGEMGTALAAVEPDGIVQVRDAPWRARTNRATPIPAGEAVRVVGIDGLLLEVEPAEGGARDAGH